MDRPNILLICTDQQSHMAMSNAGNPDLHTPAMDRLAETGVTFENAYCTFPLCTPSRAAMFSGVMPHQAGVMRNGDQIDPQLRERELGRWLGANGYDCYYGGKWHVPEPEMPPDNDHGFEVICGFHDHKLTDTCVDFISDRAGDRPFFLVAGFDNPHNICEWARSQSLPWGSVGEPPPPEQCPNLPANFQPSPFEPEAIRHEQQAHRGIYAYQDCTPEQWRRLRWAYYRLCEKVDAQIGRILDALDEAGLTDDTLIVFTADHGDAHGAHRWNQKSVLFEEAIGIPLIISGPDIPRGRRDNCHPVSNALDLMPTLCDYTDIEPPEGLPGLSLMPLMDGGHPQWREALLIETRFDGGRGYDTQGRAVRTEQHKYVAYDRGLYREQLHDMLSDRAEMVNLAVEARHQPLLQRMRQLLQDHAETTGDQFRVPDLSQGHGRGW